MIGALILAGLLAQPPQMGASDTPLPPIVQSIDRAAILARDPRALPRAEKDTWRNFEFARYGDEPVKSQIARAKDAILGGDFVGALSELLAVLEARPDFPPALHMTGILYWRLQRYGDSAAMLERYVDVAPERIGETRVLGHDLYTLGLYAEARAHYERVLEKVPGDVEALRGLALTLWRSGDTDAALARLARGLEIAPGNADLWSWKAAIAFDAGENEAAREAAERALSIDAFEARTWFTLARVLDETGREPAAAAARARFEALSRSASAVRRAEARLLVDPKAPALIADWLDARVAHGAPGPLRAALQQISRYPELRRDPVVVRAELDACRLLADRERGGAAAVALEKAAGEDARAWRSLLAWFETVGDSTGAARAGAHLGH